MIRETVISLRDLEYRYPDMERAALQGLSLEVRQGEWVALIGSNGSGKSTLAKHLNALLVPTQGACFICGLDSRKEENLWEIRRNLSMVFQNPENQIVSTVVEDDAAFGPENLGLPPQEIRQRVHRALETAGLLAQAKRAVYTLSGGQKQRLAIAGALAMGARCIVLDEPTAMLDPQGRQSVIDLLGRLHEEGITIIHVTHHLEEIMDADRVFLLSQGKLAWQGTPEELLRQKDLDRRWGLEVPPLAQLRRGLIDAGKIPAGTGLSVEEIVNCLCPS